MCDTTKGLASELFRVLRNRNSMDAFDVLEVLISEHPTHQASIIRSLSEILEGYSNIRGDGRNLAAIEYAQRATKASVNKAIPYI